MRNSFELRAAEAEATGFATAPQLFAFHNRLRSTPQAAQRRRTGTSVRSGAPRAMLAGVDYFAFDSVVN